MGASAAEVTAARVTSQLSVTEELKGAPGCTGKTVTSDYFNLGPQLYGPATTIPVTHYSHAEYTLDGGGAATIDLTALLGTQEDIDATGLKVQLFRVKSNSADNGALTISPGAANPYVLFGAGNSLVYPAGLTLDWPFPFGDKLADVAAGVKNIDLAGTAGNVFDIEILVG